MTTKVATFGLTQQIIAGFKSTQGKMAELQRQMTDGTKSVSYAGYGSDASRLQRSKSAIDVYGSYINTISLTNTDLKAMQNSLSESKKELDKVTSAINLQLTKSGTDYDLTTVKAVAQAALESLKASMNSDLDGRYLFSGAQTQVKPYENQDLATSSTQGLTTNWLNGTLTQQQFQDAVDNLTTSQLGFNASIPSAGRVVARADDNFEMDYTVKATDSGFKDAVAALNIIANMQIPNGTTDVASSDQFYDSIQFLYKKLQGASTELNESNKQITSISATLETVKTQHESDKATAQSVVDSVQAVDTATAIVTFQSYATQLEASFRATSAIGQLNLSKYLTF